jgi:hypothetical protein
MRSLGSGGKTLDALEDISEATFEQQQEIMANPDQAVQAVLRQCLQQLEENLNSRKVSFGHTRIAKGGGTIPCSQNTRRYDEKLGYGLP